MSTCQRGKSKDCCCKLAGRNRPRWSKFYSRTEKILVVLFTIMVMNGWTLAEGAIYAKEEARSLSYQHVSLGVYSDAGYFTNNSFASIQYKEGVGFLNWQNELVKEIGLDVKVRVTVKRKEDKKLCVKEVYDSGIVPFCKPLPKEALRYLDLVGFDDSDPPVTKCPHNPGMYKVTNFQPSPSELEGIETGILVGRYVFYLHGQIIISFALEMKVT